MKIALCFSGAIREFKYCYPSIYKYVINQLNPDIFIHGWIMGDTSKLNVKYKMKIDSCDEKYIIDKLKPKKCVIDKYTLEWESLILKKANMCDASFDKNIPKKYLKLTKSDKSIYKKYAYNSCGMYYKIMKCNELKSDYEKEHNFKYDIVIRIRFDFRWNNYLLIKDIENIKENEIIIIKDDYVSVSKIVTNDKFFIGKSKTMDTFCNVFNDIHNMYDEGLSVQGSDISQYTLSRFKVILLGNKNYYHKFHKNHNRPNKYDKIICINVFNELTLYIANLLMAYNYIVYVICKNKILINRMICNYNLNIIKNVSDCADIYLMNDVNLKFKNKKIFTFDKNIIIRCDIIDEICEKRETHKLKNNECFITELSEFIFYYILHKDPSHITIDGSRHCSIEIAENVRYNTFFNQNKVNTYVEGKIINVCKNTYDIKLKNKTVKNCPEYYIDIINKYKYFEKNKIYSKFMLK